jgi:aldose sugar dehydrogenase
VVFFLDVAADPRFPENRLVYISYSEPEGNGAAGTSVARGRLGDAGLEDVQVIYRQQPKVSGPESTLARAWSSLAMAVFS